MATPFKRSFEFDRTKINSEDRTVPVCFSSETPVDRGEYDEVLDHSAEGVDLTRLKDAHPLLLNHDPDKQIGVIESAVVDADRRGRALIRFGRSTLADEIFQDVKDGIRKHLSVGYERVKAMATEVKDGGRKAIRFAWRPFEISVVPVPADQTVGVGRAGANQTRTESNMDCAAKCRTAWGCCNDLIGTIEECGESGEGHMAAIAACRNAIAALVITWEDVQYWSNSTAAECVAVCKECSEICAGAVEAISVLQSCPECNAEAKECIDELEEAIECCQENAGIDTDDAGTSTATSSMTEQQAVTGEGMTGGTTVDADTRTIPSNVDTKTLTSAAKTNESTMSQQATATTTGNTQPNVIEIENQALTRERSRAKDIRAAAAAISGAFPKSADKFRTLVDQAIDGGTTVEDFRATLLRETPGFQQAEVITTASLGVSEHEAAQYSLVRAVQSCIERNQKTPDGLEGEIHKTMASRIGKSVGSDTGGPGGFWVPFDRGFTDRRSNRMMGRRDLSVGTFGQGGAFVQTTIVTPIIEILRNRMVTQRLGVQSMGGLEGNIAIPRQTGAATAYAVAETAALTVATQALDQVALAPKRVGAVGKYSKQLLLQSSVDVENFIRDDLMKVLAIKWDKLILEGSGSASEPTGILNTTGIGSVTFGAAATYAKMVSFETALALANADEGTMAYVTTPSVREKLKTAAKIGSTFPIFIWEDGEWGDGTNDGVVNSYRAACTNQIANNAVAFGHWADAIHALWGGFDVIVNPYTFDVNAQVQITINTFGDVAVRHAASFAWSADSGAQ